MGKVVLDERDIKSLKAVGVRAVILFGSQALGIAREGGDWDVAVIGSKSKVAYDAVYDIMTAKINQLVDIDIVFLREAPLELQKHVAKYGVVLFQESPNVFADFKQRLMLDYADFAPHRYIFQKATMDRIPL